MFGEELSLSSGSTCVYVRVKDNVPKLKIQKSVIDLVGLQLFAGLEKSMVSPGRVDAE